MKKSNTIKQVSQRQSRTEYTGTYQDFQSFGKSTKEKIAKPYSQYEKDPYNKFQNVLYKRAMFGLKVYTQEEVKAMHPGKIERIEKVNQRAQRELNIFKQEKLIEITNKFFSIFKKTSLGGEMIDMYSKPDPKFTSRSSLKDLDIAKEDIIERLSSKGILPRDFYSLKQ